MKRREVTVILTALALARTAAAQPAGKVWRIGWLGEGATSVPGAPQPVIGPFFEALRERGYSIGLNLAVESRYAEGKIERLPILAAELVGRRPDLIVAPGTREALALKSATSTIPIVMLFPGDPVGAGLVTSLASPGGNITGTSLMFPDVSGKRLELLREIVPACRRVAILGNPKNASSAADIRGTEAAANSLGMKGEVVGVDSQDRLADSLGEIAKGNPDCLLLIQDTVVLSNRVQIAEFAVQNRLASVAPGRAYVESGSLIGYGPSLPHVARRAAFFADRILKGAKPAELPIEQPTTFELLINLKTARALGLDVPATLLSLATEVIE